MIRGYVKDKMRDDHRKGVISVRKSGEPSGQRSSQHWLLKNRSGDDGNFQLRSRKGGCPHAKQRGVFRDTTSRLVKLQH